MSALYARINSDSGHADKNRQATRGGHYMISTSAETWDEKIVTTLHRDRKTKDVRYTVELCQKDARSGTVLAEGVLPA